MVPEVRRVGEVLLVHKECLEWRDKRDLLVLMDLLAHQVLQDLMDHLVTGDHLVCLDLLDLLDLEDSVVLREKEESQERLAKKVHQDLLDFKGHLVLLVPEANVERKARLENKEHLD